MNLSVHIDINRSKEKVWAAITDIEHCDEMISAITKLNIIKKPNSGLVGLTWQETRIMFGQESSETMWITECVENDYYCTRAESHGAVYLTRLALQESDGLTRLTMTFTGQAQTLLAKLLSGLMNVFIVGSMKKALLKDLQDIKQFVESPPVVS